MRSLCLRCGRRKASYEQVSLVCQNCFFEFQASRWAGCARCGKGAGASCGGLCGELGPFLQVRALFTLEPKGASLLVAAKDTNDLVAQEVFESLYTAPLVHALRSTMCAMPISHVMLSPLRGARVFAGHWHPVVFFERAVATAIALRKVDLDVAGVTVGAHPEPIVVCSAWAQGNTRQASRNAAERHREVALAQASNLVLELKEAGCENDSTASRCVLPSGHAGTPQCGVLFIDDVLTSGGSALKAKEAAPAELRAMPWSVLTIFRTPRLSPAELTAIGSKES